jgi:hypothetical protein
MGWIFTGFKIQLLLLFFNLKGCLVGLLKGTSMNNGLNMVSKKGFNLMGF